MEYDDERAEQEPVSTPPQFPTLHQRKQKFYEAVAENRRYGNGVEKGEAFSDFPEKQYITHNFEYKPGRYRDQLRGVALSGEIMREEGRLTASGPDLHAVPYAVFRRARDLDVIHLSRLRDWEEREASRLSGGVMKSVKTDQHPLKRTVNESELPVDPVPLSGESSQQEDTMSPVLTSKFSPDSSDESITEVEQSPGDRVEPGDVDAHATSSEVTDPPESRASALFTKDSHGMNPDGSIDWDDEFEEVMVKSPSLDVQPPPRSLGAAEFARQYPSRGPEVAQPDDHPKSDEATDAGLKCVAERGADLSNTYRGSTSGHEHIPLTSPEDPESTVQTVNDYDRILFYAIEAVANPENELEWIEEHVGEVAAIENLHLSSAPFVSNLVTEMLNRIRYLWQLGDEIQHHYNKLKSKNDDITSECNAITSLYDNQARVHADVVRDTTRVLQREFARQRRLLESRIQDLESVNDSVKQDLERIVGLLRQKDARREQKFNHIANLRQDHGRVIEANKALSLKLEQSAKANMTRSTKVAESQQILQQAAQTPANNQPSLSGKSDMHFKNALDALEKARKIIIELPIRALKPLQAIAGT